MSGYYPATYGFENDLVGNDPYGWTVFEPGSQNVEIISSLDGHNNVLEMFDTESGSGAQAQANTSFVPQTSGIIEYWYRTSGFQEAISIRVQKDNDFALYLYSEGGNFVFENGSGPYIITACNNDQWYHIKFVFNCTSDTYDFYLNGALTLSNIEFYTKVSSLNKIIFSTRQWGTNSDFYGYVDALGYSWEPNYNIGDNLNEGLLLSYENATNLDWKGYSFDGQSNKTILGNTTIAMPDFGLHNLQVFGNDSFGTTCESAIRYFSISPINIITPENKTYTQPMSGYYPGTYGFENEEDNDLGTEVAFITRYESDHSDAYARIEDNIYGRNNVLKFYDAATTNNYNFYAYHDFPTKIPYGTIEFWVLNYSGDRLGIYYHFSNSSGADYISVDTFNSLFYIIIDGDNNGLVKIQTGNGERSWSDLYSDDTWHHIRIDFESTLGGYLGLEQYKLNFWFDGMQLLTNEPLIINDSLGVIASHSQVLLLLILTDGTILGMII